VFDGKAYLGYWLDADTYAYYSEGGSDDEASGGAKRLAGGLDRRGDKLGVKSVPVLIFEDNTGVEYLRESLAEVGAKRTIEPVRFENWWSGRIIDVDPKSYYSSVMSKFMYYLDVPEHIYHLLSVWTAGTAFHMLFDAYPYLHFHGIKRTGKSRGLKLIKVMAFNGIMSGDMSTPSMYRLVESGHMTFLLDEQDYLHDPERRTEVRRLLLNGYKKGSYVYRSEKTEAGIVPTGFGVYSPKAMANIEGLEDVLQDRTITITMMRSKDPKILRRTDPREGDPAWLELRDKLASLYLKRWRDVQGAYDAVLRALGDEEDYSGVERYREYFVEARKFIYSRMMELWSPMLAMALFFESSGVDGVLEAVLRAASESARERRADEAETPEAGLVYALKKVYKDDGWYALADIHAAYREATGVEKVRPEAVGRMMRRLGLKQRRRVAGRAQYYITSAAIEDLAKRLGVEELLLPGEPPQLLQPPQGTSSEGGMMSDSSSSSSLNRYSSELPEGLLAKAIDYAYRRRGEFTLGELALALGASVGEARRAAESLARQGLLIRLDEATFRAAKA
jgi:hypothetical protein